MTSRIRWSLLPSVIASFGLVSSNLWLSPMALAQSAPPPAPPGTSSTPETSSEPPARVGWLSNLSGAVSFHSADQNQWTSAAQNYPFATGDALWTQPQAQASIMLDSSKLALNGGSEFTAQEIDASTLTGVLSQGEMFLNIVSLQSGQTIVIQTPRGTAQIAGDGQYEIYVGDTTTPTYVTVVSGSLQFTGLGQTSAQTVNAQQSLVVSGSDPVQSQLGAMQQDQFLTTMLQEITPPPPPGAAAPPPVVAQMTGASVLARYGTWQSQPSAGTVWFPQVASTWVPYREGRWAYVQPWGWTWVDNAPWGFAPFHYGRWAQFGGRWGWVPAPAVDQGFSYNSYHPVYAPALVTFLGVAAGALTAAALSSGSIGWAPLGLRQAYYPPYAVSARYFNAYNRPYIHNYNTFYQRNVTVVNNRISYRNVQIINEGHGPGGFNHPGATFAPVGAMMGSRPIAGVAHGAPQGARIEPFRPGELHKQLPRPSAATWGVTPDMAKREHLPPAPAGAERRAPAPGPAIRPTAFKPGQHEAPPHLVAHTAQAPHFHAGAPAAMHEAGPARGQQPLHGAEHGAPAAPIAAHGMPPVPQAGGHGEAPRPAFHPAAPAGAEHGVRTPEAGQKPEHPAAPQHAAEAPRVEAPRPEAPRPEPHAAPRVEAAPHAAAPRPEAHAAPRVEAPRPEAHATPRVEAAPRPEAHAAPRAEAPRPEAHAAPRVEAPRPEVHAAPREAPRPAPHAAPRPAPHPTAHAVPHPAPHGAPHEAPKRPPEH